MSEPLYRSAIDTLSLLIVFRLWHTVEVNEAKGESEPVQKLEVSLENVEKISEQNFSRIKDRLFDFYYNQLRDKLISEGEASMESTREEIRNMFEPHPENLKIDNLRLIKAFMPYSVIRPENISPWVPEATKNEILNDLKVANMADRSERYFGNNVSLGVVQLLREEGLLSASHSDSSITDVGGVTRQSFEKAVSEIVLQEVHPNYAVVKKHSNDQEYTQAVRGYGISHEKPEMGILTVLSMEGKVGRKSTFTFGDSTVFLTSAEMTKKRNAGVNLADWISLERAILQGDLSQKSELEKKITEKLFPKGDYYCEANTDGMRPWLQIIPSSQTIKENILGTTSLILAYNLNDKLLRWKVINPSLDYLEAQILNPLKPSDCERILINESVKPYLKKILKLMPEKIQQDYQKLLEDGIIRYHRYK